MMLVKDPSGIMIITTIDFMKMDIFTYSIHGSTLYLHHNYFTAYDNIYQIIGINLCTLKC